MLFLIVCPFLSLNSSRCLPVRRPFSNKRLVMFQICLSIGLFIIIIYSWLVCCCALQETSAENFLGHWWNRLFKLGPGYMSGCCMDPLLLLHLERSQVHWQGETSSSFLLRYLICRNNDISGKFKHASWTVAAKICLVLNFLKSSRFSSGGVLHGHLPLHHVTHPLDQRSHPAWSLSGNRLLPLSWSESTFWPTGGLETPQVT